MFDQCVALSIGLILERLVGRFAFAAVYVAAGVFASLVNLSANPLAAMVGNATSKQTFCIDNVACFIDQTGTSNGL